MASGKVKFFNESKGFGFIKTESGEEIFVHATALKQELREGDEVTFDIEQGKRGPSAINVELV
ncbi:cold shock domain-containing protein [Pedobacter aquatilis]|uniref:cold-shock protein n=1 Tax=Pedobacter aquatilis TaxID=351343 RepID=UPI002930C112|nr:cold shock domain-containing protein [Pedobacter aquatilis]